MQGRYIPATVTLIAGLIASIICLIQKMSIIKSLTTVLVTLVIFLVLGTIAKKVIILTLTDKEEVSEKEPSEASDTNENPEHENDTQES